MNKFPLTNPKTTIKYQTCVIENLKHLPQNVMKEEIISVEKHWKLLRFWKCRFKIVKLICDPPSFLCLLKEQYFRCQCTERLLYIGPTFSGVARAFPGGRVAHPERQNEEENE